MTAQPLRIPLLEELLPLVAPSGIIEHHHKAAATRALKALRSVAHNHLAESPPVIDPYLEAKAVQNATKCH